MIRLANPSPQEVEAGEAGVEGSLGSRADLSEREGRREEGRGDLEQKPGAIT